jgi:hypothetical protein
VNTTSGPQYGNLGLVIVTMVGGTDLLVGGLVAIGLPSGWLIGSTIASLFGALWVYRSSKVEVNDDGVTICMVGGMAMSAPWDEIESVQTHLFGVWLVRRTSRRRVLFSGLDPWWKIRPVSKSILDRVSQSEGGRRRSTDGGC